MAPWLKLLHIVSSFLMVTGLVARGVSFRRAGLAKDFASTHALLSLSAWFDKKLVVPWSMVLLLSGLAAAHSGGWPLFVLGRPTWVLVSIVLNLSLIPVIALVLAPRARARDRAAAASLAEGRVTDDLARALHDRGVIRARRAEMVVIAAVLFLMISKPF
jgi:uncharacterized membrane protein